MKNINETILKHMHSLDYISKYCAYINNASEFFNNDIPNSILESINNGETPDYVWENLQTHDVEKLKTQLENHFYNDIEEFINKPDPYDIDLFYIIP